MSADDTLTIAMLGLGTMGGPMARNLLTAGHDVRVWNRSEEKRVEVADAVACDSPAEAAAGADLCVTMLSDGFAVESVMTGEQGGLAGLDGAAVWLQMSTVGVDSHERLEKLAGEHGIAYVDAPVLGTRQPAEQGALIVLASGEDADLERARPVFEAVGSKTVIAGAAGSGTRLKLVLNGWLLSLVEGLAETIAFAEAIGVDPATFLETIDGGPLGPQYAQLKGKQMIDREFPPSFSLKLARKDAGLVQRAAEREQVAVPLIDVIASQMDIAIEQGHGEQDLSATFFASVPRA
ncbi:MAG: NAD(P)-dependent oxidoreductase [Thermoleophilaceae bacterium]